MANLSNNATTQGLNGITPQELNAYPQNVLTGAEIITITIGNFTYRVTLNDLRKFSMPNKQELGLDKVNNTSDVDKPVSTAHQNALNLKADKTHGHTVDDIQGLREVLQSLINIATNPSVEVVESQW